MYKLYYSPGTCSLAVHVVLNELVAPFDLIKISLKDGDNKKPEFLKINLRGSVPVLEDDGLIIREGAAILVYLLDKHKSPLLPQSGADRARALEWLMFGNATMHPAYGKAFGFKKTISDAAKLKELLDPVYQQVCKLWDEVETQLGKTPYVAGQEITAGDILLSVFANWAPFEKPVPFGPNTQRMLKEVVSRPSYQKALAAEGVEYKAAA